MLKIIKIKKYDNEWPYWYNLDERKQITLLSVEEIINKYNGFEGELIEFIEEEKFNLKDLLISDYDTLLLSTDHELTENVEIARFEKVGYDYGICEKDSILFSSIFNEVLFGIEKPLISYQINLNNNFLFPNYEIAQKYQKLHDECFLNQMDVEENELMKIYEIWKISK